MNTKPGHTIPLGFTADKSTLEVGFMAAKEKLEEFVSLRELFNVIGQLPSEWKEIMVQGEFVIWQSQRRKLRVGVSIMKYGDGKRWLHVSVSKKDQAVPTWADMCNVKQAFIGRNRRAIQVHPAEERHVNIHPGCLHLWRCLDEDPLPEFSHVVDGERVI